MQDDYWLKIGGLVFGAAGFFLSLYAIWRGRDKYDVRLQVRAGKREGLRQTVIVVITNAGNKAFSVVRALYTQPDKYDDEGRSFGQLKTVFYTPTPEQIIFLQPGETKTLSFAYLQHVVLPLEVTIETHNRMTFTEPAEWFFLSHRRIDQFLLEAFRRGLDHWDVELSNDKKSISVIEEPNFMTGEPADETSIAERDKLPPILIPLPDGSKKEILSSPATDDYGCMDRYETLLGQLYGNLPMLFQRSKDQGRHILHWKPGLEQLGDDPESMQALAAELGINTAELPLGEDIQGFALFFILLLLIFVFPFKKKRRNIWNRIRSRLKRPQRKAHPTLQSRDR